MQAGRTAAKTFGNGKPRHASLEAALHASEERLMRATRTGKVGIWEWDIVNDQVTWSDSLYAIHGVDRATFQANVSGWASLVHPEDRAIVQEALRRTLEESAPYELEFRSVRPDGNVVWLFTNAEVIRDGAKPLRMLGSSLDITQNKLNELALRETEQRYRQLVQGLPAAVCTCDAQGRIDLYNEAAVALWGRVPETDLWCGSYKIFNLDGSELPLEHCPMARTINTGKPVRGEEIVIERPDGTRRHVLANPEPIRNSRGEITGALNILLDITDRRSTEHALRRSEERFARFMQHLPGLAWIKDLDGRYVFANEAAVRAFGVKRTDLYGKRDEEIFPPGTSAQFRANDRDALASSTGVETIETLEQDDGLHSSIVAKFPIPDADGKPALIGGIAIDITERVRMEEAAQRLASIVETSDDAIYSTDLQGSIASWNAGAERLYGYTAAEAVGQPITVLVPPEMREEEAAIVMQVRGGGPVRNLETRRMRKNGERIAVSITVSPTFDPTGRVTGESRIARDCTERQRAESAVRRLAAIVESSDDAIIAKDLTGVIISWNNAAERLYGYTAEEIFGKPITLLIPEDRHDEEPRLTERLRRGESIEHYETFRRRKDGSLVEVSLTISPIKDARGQMIGVSKIARDITEQKLEERRKDDFISMASHELRTPVTTLKAITQLMQQDEPVPQEEMRLYLDKMHRQVERLNALVSDLLDVAKVRKGQLEYRNTPFELDPLVKEVVEEIQHGTRSHRIQVHGTTRQRILGDRERIGQAIANLLTNAVKYSPHANTLEVTLLTAEGKAGVRVKDHGIGIPEKERTRIFDRFYRVIDATDKAFPGLGMGLSIVAEVVRQHKGSIAVESELGKGSTFTLWLPVIGS